MTTALITIVETTPYKRFAERHLSEVERATVIEMLAANPAAGDLIQGSGGVRKVRVAAKGWGKSGGARVIYFYHNDRLPVFLLTGYPKGERENLTKAQVNEMAKAVRLIVESYGR